MSRGATYRVILWHDASLRRVVLSMLRHDSPHVWNIVGWVHATRRVTCASYGYGQGYDCLHRAMALLNTYAYVIQTHAIVSCWRYELAIADVFFVTRTGHPAGERCARAARAGEASRLCRLRASPPGSAAAACAAADRGHQPVHSSSNHDNNKSNDSNHVE